jgi:hypothetical protein
VELAQKSEAFARRGLNIAVITYDNPAILKHFAERQRIPYPLLSDEGSKVIRAFGILNTNVPATDPLHGIPFPGTYVLNERGVVKSKYFEEDYRERVSGGAILLKEFGPEASGQGSEIRTPHLTLKTSASSESVSPGTRMSLTLEVTLRKNMHVYAPGVEKPYIPIQWKLADSKAWVALPAAYPASRILHLKAIGEKLPVYERRITLTTDIVIGQNAEIKTELSAENKLKLTGEFRYQACNDKVCYPPATVPLEWTFPVTPLDTQRVPAELRKPAK